MTTWHSEKSTHAEQVQGKKIFDDVVAKVKTVINPKKPWGFGFALVYYMTAAFMDPLFLYTRVIDDTKTCIELDKTLGIATAVFRSVYDLYYLLFLTLIFNKHERIRFWLDVFTILPLPQVLVILSIIKRTRREGIWDALGIVLIFQHMLRVLRVGLLLTNRKISGRFWEWAAVFMLTYLYASHMFGALWYFLAIDKVSELWEKTTTGNRIACIQRDSLYCDNNKISLSCHKPLNETIDDLGIYKDATKYRIVHTKAYIKKVFFCFRWGLQNLSGFGQSLETGIHLQENLYIVSLTLTGVLLFFFLMGRMQVYLQNETLRVEETKKKWAEIKQWKPFTSLDNNELKKKIEMYLKDEGAEIKEITIKNLLNSISKDNLRKEIKLELCLELLKKVRKPGNLGETTLSEEALCDYVKPVFYIERQYIIREGDPVDEMLFIVSGDLRTYTSTNHCCNEDNHLKDGGFFGEELLDWAQNQPSSNLPISTKTIRALTSVDAFVLGADDLKDIFNGHKQQQVKSAGTIAEEP